MQVRKFNASNIEYLDKLLKYLAFNKISYTAHWVYPSDRRLDVDEAEAAKNPVVVVEGEETPTQKNYLIMQIRWFE